MAQNPDPVVRTDDPEVIAQDIRETRSDMSETIDALANKLDPDHLKRQATDAISGAAHDMIDKAKDAFTGPGGDGGSVVDSMMTQVRGSSALDAVKANPLPALAVGLSVAWFLSKLGESEQERYRADRFRDTGDPYYAPRSRGYLDAAYQSYPEYGSDDRYRGGLDARGYGEPARFGAAGGMSTGTASDASIADTARSKAAGLTDQATEAVSGAVDTVKHAASDAADAVSGAADSLTGDAHHRADDVRHRASQMQRRSVSWMDEQMQRNPILVGAVSLAAGALVGLSLPETEAEHNLMGSQAQQVRDQALQQARAAADAARGPVADAASAVAEEAKTAADDVAQTAKVKADDAAASAKEKAGDLAESAERKAGDVTDRAEKKADDALGSAKGTAAEDARDTPKHPSSAAVGTTMGSSTSTAATVPSSSSDGASSGGSMR